MSKPTSYELLKDTYAEIRSLRLEMTDRFEKVEARVDVLEDFRGRILGGATILGAFAGAIGSWVWGKLTGK
jgi:hypothetical protein